MNKQQRDTMGDFLADLVVELGRDEGEKVPSRRHWDHLLVATMADGTTQRLPLQDVVARVLRGRAGDELVSLSRGP